MSDFYSQKKPAFASFTGAYMSGFYINDKRLLTTMSLLYDKIYLPNHLEYVIEFSKKYKFNNFKKVDNIIIKPHHSNEDDPFKHLTTEQRITANQYLNMVKNFSICYHKLFGDVLISDFYPNNEILNAKLVKQGAVGEMNTYEVSINPMIFSLDNYSRTSEILESGAIPIFERKQMSQNMNADKYPGKFLASLLAMKSIHIVLPPLKSAKPEVILEARYQLRDYLPPFWAEMLRFSQVFKGFLSQSSSINEVMFEANDFVDFHIRPLLIDINNKMLQERKDRFKDIISPSMKESTILSIGKPSVTKSEIINVGLPSNNNFIDYSMKDESGLTFLLNLSSHFSGKMY